jgi:hypothetical protein
VEINNTSGALPQAATFSHEVQVLQYLIVNDQLEKLHVRLYDPRISTIDLFHITVERESVAQRLEHILEPNNPCLLRSKISSSA